MLSKMDFKPKSKILKSKYQIQILLNEPKKTIIPVVFLIMTLSFSFVWIFIDPSFSFPSIAMLFLSLISIVYIKTKTVVTLNQSTFTLTKNIFGHTLKTRSLRREFYISSKWQVVFTNTKREEHGPDKTIKTNGVRSSFHKNETADYFDFAIGVDRTEGNWISDELNAFALHLKNVDKNNGTSTYID